MRLSKIIARVEDAVAPVLATTAKATTELYADARALAREKKAAVHQLRVQLRAKRMLKQLALDNEALAYLAAQAKEG